MQKKFFYSIISILSLIFISWSIIVIIVDPEHQFRESSSEPRGSMIGSKMGIAKNHQYQVAVFGASTSQNLTNSDVSNAFNAPAFNFSIGGTTVCELRTLLKQVLQKRNVKTVIIGIHYDSYTFPQSKVFHPIPAYLNSAYPWTYLEYFCQMSTYRSILKLAFDKSKPNPNWAQEYGSWYRDKKEHFTENAVFDFSQKFNQMPITKALKLKGPNQQEMLQLMCRNFEDILHECAERPDINYIYYFPPIHEFWWIVQDRYQLTDMYLQFEKYVITKCSEFPNVQVYDFQNMQDVIGDPMLWIDLFHFSIDTDRRMLSDMIHGKSKASLDQLDIFADSIKQNAAKYNPVFEGAAYKKLEREFYSDKNSP